MSLINDALKRAGAEQPRATLPPGEVPPMQPVFTASAKTSPVLIGGVLLVGIGAIAIAAALWFKGREPQLAHAAAPATQVGSAVPADRSHLQPTPQPQTVAAIPRAVGTAPSLPKTTTAPAKTTPVVSAPNPPTTIKPIRLQSIFYRLKSPTVIINGKTLGIGDSVDGIKVVSIQRTSVEVVQNGKYRTLTLQD